jgi:hypothetical protein
MTNKKLHRHCEKTLDEEASCLERTSKGFSWQSPNIDITSYCKDIPRNYEQKPHRHCGKTLDEDASYLERTSKGFSWQSPNVEIALFLPMTLRMWFLFLKEEIATSPLSILGNEDD